YHPRTGTWDGRWTVVVETTALAGPARASVRAHLAGMGLGPLGGGVHAAPADRTDALRQLLADLGLGDRLAVFRGELPPGIGLGNREVAGILCPELKDLEPAWRSFVRRFGPIAEAASAEGAEAVSPGTAFGARTLLVHEYRRITLREPELPSGLWPPGWVGETAYEVAARCYHAVSAAAEAHLLAVCDADRSPLLPYDPEYADRFAGVRSLAPTDLKPRRYSGSSCEP
ncbi:MAG: PaaX family transcriptional regulator C-terminal domain-containing protein, partial [Acidimicrobiia bacterium]